MYKKYNISHCTQKEIEVLNSFKQDYSDKVVTVYYSTEGHQEIGYSLIATIDKPITRGNKVDFGRYIDITDYEDRLSDF